MQLDKCTDYALRVLMTQAVRAPDRVPTSEIAALFGLSEHHLSKVATQLVRDGFVVSARGRNGGISLARRSDGISIGEVVRAFKRDVPVVECFGADRSCLILRAARSADPSARGVLCDSGSLHARRRDPLPQHTLN